MGYLGLWACTIHVVLPFAGLVCVILEHFCFQWSSFLAVMLVAMGQRRGLRQRGLVAGGCGGTERVAGLVKDLARAGHCIDWELILLIKSSWWQFAA